VTQDTGSTHVVKDGTDYGTFSNRLWKNSNEGLREYSALQFQAAYNPLTHLRLQGHYTLQLKNDGNQEGEGQNTPGAPSAFPGFYPELFNEARSFPIGHLVGFQQHRARIWGTYDLELRKAGTANLSLLYRFDSGSAYSIASTGVDLTDVQTSTVEKYYVDSPGTQTVFYSLGRGSEKYQDAHLFDFAVNYNVPVWKKVRPWVKLEVRNIFNSTPLISYDTTVSPDPSSPTDSLGLPTGYVKEKTFGTGRASSNYPNPREFLMSAGIRF